MKYTKTGYEIQIGDSVSVEDGAEGTVVCDFDRKLCISGYEDWITNDDSTVDGIPSRGILVKTKKYGLIHYETEDETIVRR
ncbi:hypothetical protein [Paraburkholderia lycopersici]|uniref:hypothetical protein n=1 Tax=Paraburkholderia lycopersici TaxID=416944 RepID=UPI0011612BF3|nr:hypothetical protein [Paraburkholderia lycopersici]